VAADERDPHGEAQFAADLVGAFVPRLDDVRP
jgi:hypothetical protein